MTRDQIQGVEGRSASHWLRYCLKRYLSQDSTFFGIVLLTVCEYIYAARVEAACTTHGPAGSVSTVNVRGEFRGVSAMAFLSAVLL